MMSYMNWHCNAISIEGIILVKYLPEPFCIQASLGKGCHFLLRDSSEEGDDSE